MVASTLECGSRGGLIKDDHLRPNCKVKVTERDAGTCLISSFEIVKHCGQVSKRSDKNCLT